jgi:hypothetical protein
MYYLLVYKETLGGVGLDGACSSQTEASVRSIAQTEASVPPTSPGQTIFLPLDCFVSDIVWKWIVTWLAKRDFISSCSLDLKCQIVLRENSTFGTVPSSCKDMVIFICADGSYCSCFSEFCKNVICFLDLKNVKMQYRHIHIKVIFFVIFYF